MKIVRYDQGKRARWGTVPDLTYVLARGGGGYASTYIGSMGHMSACYYTVWL